MRIDGHKVPDLLYGMCEARPLFSRACREFHFKKKSLLSLQSSRGVRIQVGTLEIFGLSNNPQSTKTVVI